jgi:hypothetical protein
MANSSSVLDSRHRKGHRKGENILIEALHYNQQELHKTQLRKVHVLTPATMGAQSLRSSWSTAKPLNTVPVPGGQGVQASSSLLLYWC